jgi:hypothetical protein
LWHDNSHNISWLHIPAIAGLRESLETTGAPTNEQAAIIRTTVLETIIALCPGGDDPEDAILIYATLFNVGNFLGSCDDSPNRIYSATRTAIKTFGLFAGATFLVDYTSLNDEPSPAQINDDGKCYMFAPEPPVIPVNTPPGRGVVRAPTVENLSWQAFGNLYNPARVTNVTALIGALATDGAGNPLHPTFYNSFKTVLQTMLGLT